MPMRGCWEIDIDGSLIFLRLFFVKLIFNNNIFVN